MNLRVIKANMTELELKGGLIVLFSYQTPVACVWTNGSGSRVLFKTEKKWSPTTSRHISTWSDGWTLSEPPTTKSQEYFDSIVKGA